MQIKKVKEFYEAALAQKKFSSKFFDELRGISTESELKSFIEKKVQPIAKDLGYKFSTEEILSYEKQMAKKITDSQLESVGGGANVKNLALGGLISLMALGAATSFASADFGNGPDTQQGESQSEETDGEENSYQEETETDEETEAPYSSMIPKFDFSKHDDYARLLEEEETYLLKNKTELIDKLYKLTGKKVKGEELYRASRDGFGSEKFHRKCDGHKNTVVIIKVKDGDVIGGYASVPWESSDRVEIPDGKAFLFSLTKNKIYKIKKDQKKYAIGSYNYEDYPSGPIFGGELENTLSISDECDDIYEEFEPSTCKLGMEYTGYESNGDDCGTFLGYPSSKEPVQFEVEDYEVYEVEEKSLTLENHKIVSERKGP